MIRPRIVAAVALAVAVTGCADRVASPALGAAPSPASIAGLVMTGAPRRPGAVVTLSARLASGAPVSRAGAFLARIEYDTAQFAFEGQGGATSGIAAFHAERGVLRVAGASLDGYAGGVLFNARFRVTGPAPDGEVRLVIDELRDVNLADRLPAAPAARTALLRPWR